MRGINIKVLTPAHLYGSLTLSGSQFRDPVTSALSQGATEMQTKVGKFTFSIPEGHPEAGQKVEKTFDYQVCDNEQEAQKVLDEKKWSIVSLVNDNLKTNARSNAYQTALLPYRPSEVPAEDIKERMIRDYIRLGIPEDTARKQVDALLAASSNPQQ
jgi:hypothetical protein